MRTSMAALSSLYSLNFTAISCPSPSSSCSSQFMSASFQCSDKKRGFVPPFVASVPYPVPANVDLLEQEVNDQGVTFEALDVCDSYTAKMELNNGSTATLMLPNGLITSYKARMWHGGVVELLQTSVMEENGGAAILGGASLAFNFQSEGGIPWSPNSWSLQSITGNPKDSVQMELSSTDSTDEVEVKCIITLREDTLSSELVVSNSSSLPVKLTGSFISHLTVSSPEATFACGLVGSDFFSIPMLLSNFSIVPPELKQEDGFEVEQVSTKLIPRGLLSGSTTVRCRKPITKEELEGEEIDNYKNLTETMSRIYTSAPSLFTIIDRGRRNSVEVGGDGLEEVYMFSPGSSYEIYGMYSYVSVGQSALLKPIVLSPGEIGRTWRISEGRCEQFLPERLVSSLCLLKNSISKDRWNIPLICIINQ